MSVGFERHHLLGAECEEYGGEKMMSPASWCAKMDFMSLRREVDELGEGSAKLAEQIRLRGDG